MREAPKQPTEAIESPSSREGQLERIFLSLADDAALSNEAHLYAEDGNGLRNCLAELAHLREPHEIDQVVAANREAYMRVALTRPTIFNRIERKQQLQRTEQAYIGSILAKLETYLSSDGSPQSALELGQMPSLLRKASFHDGQSVEKRDFAANHLHLLMDTALQEHAARRRIIDEQKQATPMTRIKNNRWLHIGVASVVFGAAFVPEVVSVPRPDEFITQDIELGLKLSSAAIFGIDGPEIIRLAYLDHIHNKRTDELNERLIANKDKCDQALRIVFGSPHYGSSQGFLAHSNRFGTDDPVKNAEMLASIDAQIEKMKGDPGGRPYSGRQALGYAARFLLERPDQLEQILQTQGIDAQQQAFLHFGQEILQEDLDRMKRGLTINRLRKSMMRGVAVILSPLITNDMSAASEAAAASRDITDHTVGRRRADT